MAKRRINLLPPGRGKELRNNFLVLAVARILNNILYGMISMTVIGLGLMGLMWGVGWSDSLVGSDDLLQKTHEYRGLKEMIERQNKLLSAINLMGQERIVWSDIFVDLMESLPVGITLHEIQTMGDVDHQILEIRGRAVTRTILVVFEERLRKLAWVDTIDAPRSNLLERDNAEFSYRMTVRKINFEDK